MSPLADPDNPNGEYLYQTRVMRDWYDDAIEKEREQWKGENYSPARHFAAFRVDRT
ncbi:hypothetical protein [Microbacterium maritypicum]